MKDFLGKELNIGDTVVLIAPNYRHLVKAIIYAFTPMQVRVEYYNTWNHDHPGLVKQFLQSPSQLIKVEE